MDHTVAYATFPNLGKAVVPHAILEVRTDAGELIWRFERDGKELEQVLAPKVAAGMIVMLNAAMESGPGQRAVLNGTRAAGTTGTIKNYRDAWFVGFTGNYVCGVWFGNDDNSITRSMTGG